MLEADGMTAGHEAEEPEELLAAVLREASRMHTRFDHVWFTVLLAERAAVQIPCD